MNDTTVSKIVGMFGEIVYTGLNEGVMGWSSTCNDILPDEIQTFIDDDVAFEQLMSKMRTVVRDKLNKCVKEAKDNVIALEQCRRNVEENRKLGMR